MKLVVRDENGKPMQSLPSRERGLKFTGELTRKLYSPVAPLAGAWVEIDLNGSGYMVAAVAPLAGAWVEIILWMSALLSIPVAPLAGAWVEISSQKEDNHSPSGRSPRGSVG